MIKVNLQTNTAQRAPLPQALKGLKAESLQNLSWTDPSLGLHGHGWWPEVDQSPELGEYQRYGNESLTVDTENQRVIVEREVVGWTQEEISKAIKEKQRQLRNEMTDAVSEYIQSAIDDYNDVNGTAFEKVHNCAAYKDIASYPHQPFCQAVLQWNADVWAKSRQIEQNVAAGVREIPTIEQLISELPVFNA